MKFGPAEPRHRALSRLSDLLSPLLRGTLKVALMRLAGVGLSFGLTAALAHWLSVAEFGTYSYILSWIGLLAMIGVYGLDRVMVRDVSVYSTQAAWNLLRGLLRWANGVALLVSLLLFGLVLLVRRLPDEALAGSAARLWLIGGLCIPMAALGQVQQSTLRGLQRLAGSQLAEVVLQPALTWLLAAALLWTGMGRLTVMQALVAYALAMGLGLAISGGLVIRALPDAVKGTAPLFRHRAWLASASHMALLTGLNAANGRVDTLALGLFQGPEAVALYSAALRGAALIPLVLNMAVIAMAPTIASLYARGDRVALQHLVTRMSQLALLGGVPIAAGMILFGRWFLLLFGPQYTAGQTALILVSLGQLVNVVAGPVASLLTMTGHERDVVMGVALGAAANLVLSLVLIRLWGINGAACASAASLVLWNVLLVWRVRQRLALSPTIGWRRH